MTGQLQHQRATRTSFFTAGVALSAWAPLVPFARERLHAGPAQLGLLMLCLGLGSVLAMPLAGLVAARIGCRRLILTVAAASCACLPGLALAADTTSLALVLFVYGASLGCMDVAINLQAVLVEREAGRPLMSGFHACFSVGCIAGAGGIALLLWLGLSPTAAVLGLVALIAAGLASQGRHLLAHGGAPAAGWRWPHGSVLVLGAVCFATFLTEGAVLDWSALALSTLQALPAERGGLGFAAFATTMTLARFAGDRLVARLGAAPVLAGGTALALAGLALAVCAPGPGAALAGYALAGLGGANIAPLVFSAAGRHARGNPQAAVAAVSTLGYSGALAGPGLIGLVAHAAGLPLALGLVALGLGVAVALGFAAVTGRD